MLSWPGEKVMSASDWEVCVILHLSVDVYHACECHPSRVSVGRVSRTLEAACRDSRAGSPRALVRQPSHRCMVPGVCLYRLSSVHLWCGFLPRNVILCHLCWCIASMQDKNEDSNLSQCQFIFCNMYVILSGLARGISRVDWDSACEMALKTSTVCTSVVAMRNLDRCSGYLCHFRPGGRHSLF